MMEALKKHRRAIILGLTVLAVVLVLFWAMRPRAVPVDTALVQGEEFEHVVTEEGVTQVRNRQVITAPADGIVPKLEQEPGDPVREGEALFTFLYDIDLVVRSPVDGAVLEVFEEDRRHVARGTPLLSVGDPRDLEVVSEVLTSEAVRIRPGQPVRITAWGGQPLRGVVDRIEPAGFEEISALGVEEQRVNVVIGITSPPHQWRQLGAGYQLEVDVITDRLSEVLTVPVGAIFDSQEGMTVFVVEDDQARSREVRVGLQGRAEAVVEEGLDPGERVILYPGNEVAEGVRVEERRG